MDFKYGGEFKLWWKPRKGNMNKNLKLLNLVTNVVKLTNLKRQCENKKEKHEKQDVQFTFFFLHMFEQICIENV